MIYYQCVLGLKIPDADALTHGDMNLDGLLNTPDLLLLQKLLLQSFFDVGAPSSGAVALNRNQGFWGGWLDRLIPPAYAFHSTSNGVLYYVHNDPLGTPQALTDETGTVVWTASYDPFGKAAVNEDPDGNGNSVTLNVRFPGQYYDQETGLHYNYFRYYDPGTGRYITADPLGVVLGMHPAPTLIGESLSQLQRLPTSQMLTSGINHLYGYAKNNPTRWIDPLGLFAECSVYPPGTGLRLICENSGNSPPANCSRECLADYYPDYSSCDPPVPPSEDPYFTDDHPFCWDYCNFPNPFGPDPISPWWFEPFDQRPFWR